LRVTRYFVTVVTVTMLDVSEAYLKPFITSKPHSWNLLSIYVSLLGDYRPKRRQTLQWALDCKSAKKAIRRLSQKPAGTVGESRGIHYLTFYMFMALFIICQSTCAAISYRCVYPYLVAFDAFFCRYSLCI